MLFCKNTDLFFAFHWEKVGTTILKRATFVIVGEFWTTCSAKTIVKEGDLRGDSEKTPFTLEEFFNGVFSASAWNGNWLTDTTFTYKDTSGDYMKYNVVTKKAEVFLDGSIVDKYSGASISLSPDETYVLIRYNVSSVFRHSTTAIYALHDISTGKYYDINDQKPIQLATFATVGHGFAYVYNNNIYYLKDALDISNPIKITEDGEVGVIYNGVPDWVYEEEVFGSGSALWFSPDGKNLAYASFNDTDVLEFSYFLYGKPGSLDDQYPTIATIKYPKAGTKNPLVNTYIYNLETAESARLNLVDAIRNTEDDNDYVLYDLAWVSNSEIVMISTNRIQNESVIQRCSLNGDCTEEISYKQRNGWLTPLIPKYNDDATRRIEILPQPHENDFYNHIVLTEVADNYQTRITYGKRVVSYIYGWDEINNLIYYAGSVNDAPSQQQIYVVNHETSIDKCLTCDFVVDGEYCKYAGASFSKSFTYYAKVCSGPNPVYAVVQNLKNESDTLVWIDNAKLRESLASKLKPEQRNLIVPINENFSARVRMLLPPDFDESKTYPAIVNVYAGPNSNRITDSYSSGVVNYFVTNRRYVYIYIDGRGSGRDGQNKMFEIYRKLGTVEIEDQIIVTKCLQQNYPFIDPKNTGIWGWSYGGFASAWALTKDTENVFKFALSVAPVTSFIYYDTIYTERYMGLPTEEDNLLGYNNTDITREVEGMRGKLYFIIHGNADDNVHYQQSMVLVKALEAADIGFRQQSYPDENHSLGSVSKHLYHTIDKFWARAFEKEAPSITTW